VSDFPIYVKELFNVTKGMASPTHDTSDPQRTIAGNEKAGDQVMLAFEFHPIDELSSTPGPLTR
jgi:hypothetical protein